MAVHTQFNQISPDSLLDKSYLSTQVLVVALRARGLPQARRTLMSRSVAWSSCLLPVGIVRQVGALVVVSRHSTPHREDPLRRAAVARVVRMGMEETDKADPAETEMMVRGEPAAAAGTGRVRQEVRVRSGRTSMVSSTVLAAAAAKEERGLVIQMIRGSHLILVSVEGMEVTTAAVEDSEVRGVQISTR